MAKLKYTERKDTGPLNPFLESVKDVMAILDDLIQAVIPNGKEKEDSGSSVSKLKIDKEGSTYQ